MRRPQYENKYSIKGAALVFPSNTPTNVPTNVGVPTSALTKSTPSPSNLVEILGRNTSIDLTHGLDEVTSAFVTLRNSVNVELTNVKTTLFALHKGRGHPDKTIEGSG